MLNCVICLCDSLDCIESAKQICVKILKCLVCKHMLMKKSEVKTCTGNGLLDIGGLVIVYSVGYTVTY